MGAEDLDIKLLVSQDNITPRLKALENQIKGGLTPAVRAAAQAEGRLGDEAVTAGNKMSRANSTAIGGLTEMQSGLALAQRAWGILNGLVEAYAGAFDHVTSQMRIARQAEIQGLDDLTESIEDLAAAQVQVTANSRQSTRELAQTFITATSGIGLTTEQIVEGIRLTQDVVADTGKGAEETARLIARAYAGNLEGLNELLPGQKSHLDLLRAESQLRDETARAVQGWSAEQQTYLRLQDTANRTAEHGATAVAMLHREFDGAAEAVAETQRELRTIVGELQEYAAQALVAADRTMRLGSSMGEGPCTSMVNFTTRVEHGTTTLYKWNATAAQANTVGQAMTSMMEALATATTTAAGAQESLNEATDDAFALARIAVGPAVEAGTTQSAAERERLLAEAERAAEEAQRDRDRAALDRLRDKEQAGQELQREALRAQAEAKRKHDLELEREEQRHQENLSRIIALGLAMRQTAEDNAAKHAMDSEKAQAAARAQNHQAEMMAGKAEMAAVAGRISSIAAMSGPLFEDKRDYAMMMGWIETAEAIASGAVLNFWGAIEHGMAAAAFFKAAGEAEKKTGSSGAGGSAAPRTAAVSSLPPPRPPGTIGERGAIHIHLDAPMLDPYAAGREAALALRRYAELDNGDVFDSRLIGRDAARGG